MPETPRTLCRPLKVLLFPRNESALVEHLVQFRLLAADPRFQPKLVSASPSVARQIEAAGIAKSDHQGFGEVPAQDSGHFRAIERLSDRVISALPWLRPLQAVLRSGRLAHSSPVALWRFAVARRSLRTAYRALSELIARERPDVILLSGDRELGIVPALCRAAREANIPAIISLTSVVAVNASSEIRQRGNVHRFQTRLSRLPSLWNLGVRWIAPQLVSKPPERVLFSPGWLISALAAEGMLNANPWVHGGGQSSHVMVEGKRKRDAFLSGGVEPAKIVLTGSVMHDRVHASCASRAATRAALLREREGDRLVLFAVPSFAEQGLTSWDRHVTEMRAAAQALSSRGAAVVVSVHPKSRAEDYSFLFDDFGLQLADWPLERIIPAADIFVCGNSSTIEMATLCGVPVINLDTIELRVSYWDDYPGVVRVGDADALRAELHRLLSDGDYFARQCAAQRSVARELSLFDGQSGDRFKAALITIANESAAARCACSP